MFDVVFLFITMFKGEICQGTSFQCLCYCRGWPRSCRYWCCSSSFHQCSQVNYFGYRNIEDIRANFLFTLVGFGLMFVLVGTPDTRENRNKRFGYFVAFCALNGQLNYLYPQIFVVLGVGMGPLLEAVIRIDPSIVLTALLSTAIVFGCFSMAALHAESTKFIHMGGTLSSAVLCLILGSFFFSHSVILWGGMTSFIIFLSKLFRSRYCLPLRSLRHSIDC